ncbi:hypothetical protein [Bradyrhizobium erythrophlei]|uniref:hypothetical protein n=1 Tax=Bradyrhizobium erythrophlei TaxID=1437360 RepID=UPI00155F93D3
MVGLLGVLRHQPLEFALGSLVVGACLPSLAKQGCKLGPGVRGIHVHYSDRRDPGLRRFAIEQRRRFTGLGGHPEGFFNGDKDCLVNRVGFDRPLDPLATAVDDEEHRFPGAGDQHVVLELGHVLLDGPLFREGPRQHDFGSEHCADFPDQPIQGCGHPGDGPVDRMALDIGDSVA